MPKSKQSNLVLEVVYELAKILVLYIQKIYYKNPVVINETFLHIDKPTILVSNHPNTLLDAVFAAASVDKQVNFLANYGLFKSTLGNAFFSTFYCIPIQRKEDMNGGATNNKASIARSHAFLADGGVLFVAAEGGSAPSLGIRPLKTGAARLALNTEDENDWQADVQILPVGFNYDEADKFRSNLVIQAGKPFSVKQWKADFYEDNRGTVRNITDYLKKQMQSLLLDGSDGEIELLQSIRKIKKVAQPTDPKREFLRTRRLLHEIKSMDGNARATLQARVQAMEEKCTAGHHTPQHVAQAWYGEKDPIHLVNLISGLPITLFGMITNVIPYFLCHFIEKKVNIYQVYRATFRVVGAMIFIPLMYLFWMWLVSSLTRNVLLTLGSLFLYRRAGVFAWDQIQDWKRYFRSRAISKQAPELVQEADSLLAYLSDRGL